MAKTAAEIRAEQKQINQEAGYDSKAGDALVKKFYDKGGIAARTQEEQQILDEREKNYNDSLKDSKAITDARSTLKNGINDVYDPQKDANLQALMQKHLGGLEGYNAEENQSLRASMVRSQQGQTASAMRQAKMLGAQGVSGGAMRGVGADIFRSSAIARALGESDLLQKNVAEKARRLDSASQFGLGMSNASIASDAEVGRRMATYSNFEQNADQIKRSSALASLNAWSTDQMNLNQQERQGRVQTYLGGVGLNMSRRGANRGNAMAEQGMKLAQEAYKNF